MPALDGLRAIAVMGVIMFHARLLPGGFLGVDFFFVLSGFLITSLLLVETSQRGRVRLSRFWARRARRLVPALVMTLLAVAAYAATLAVPTELSRIRGDGIAALFYYANWHAIFSEQGYWSLFSVPSPLAHTWSLAIEEQFYLLWPPAVIAMNRSGTRSPRRLMLTVCIVGACCSWIWMVLHYTPGDTARAYYGTDTRAGALLLGGAFAVYRSLYGDASRSSEIVASVSLAILAGAWWTLGGHDRELYLGGFAICQIATVLVLAMAARSDPGPLSRALAWGPLRYVGKISYGLYLWHWPVFVVVTEPRLGVGGAALLGLRITLSFALSAASFHAVEHPLRHGLRGRRWLFIGAAAFTAVAGVVVVGTEPRAMSGPPPRAWLPADAANRAHLSLLIAGDSVALGLARHARALEQQLSLRVVPGAAVGCGIIEPQARLRRPDGVVVRPGEACAPLALRWAGGERVDAALLVIGAPSRGEYELDGAWRHGCTAELDAHFEAQARVAVDALAQRAASVFLATMPYVRWDEYGATEDRRTDCLNAALRRATAGGDARMIDLAAYVCPATTGCQARLHGVLLRHDGQHFDGEGAELVTWWLGERIRDARSD